MRRTWTSRAALMMVVTVAIGCGERASGATSSASGASSASSASGSSSGPGSASVGASVGVSVDSLATAKADEAFTALKIPVRVKDRDDPQAKAFGQWLSRFGSWADVEPATAETTWAKIQKDPERERGKRLCLDGMVGSIRVERSEFGEFSWGHVLVEQESTRYIAVGDTGELVRLSKARFCGVVAGVMSYGDTSGGTTNAAYLVGMFDLPSNRAKK